jgi:branched-subunit amino acid aminotransferase/4-amino-4-deoxychorismate lyase
MSDPGELCWVDGRLVPRTQPVVCADDSAFTEGRGCYTSVRIRAGRPWLVDRHVRRLQQGALALGLGEVEKAEVENALADLAAAVFQDGEGIVRLQLSRGGEGSPHLVGTPRGLGPDRPEWCAVTSPFPHAGETLAGGHKLTNRLVLALAAESAQAVGADEALLFDASGRLVEGARSNLVVVTRDGPIAPPEGLGAVAGIALQVALERLPEIQRHAVRRNDLERAVEIVAVNSVRGARPVTRLDDRAVGGGAAGPFSARLSEALDAS